MRPKNVFFCCALAAGTFLAGGELINRNHSMELGVPGYGAPAYRVEINRVAVKNVRSAPDKLYFSQTAPGGNPGQCLKMPGYAGVSSYQLQLADFILEKDGEVEISFDAKIGPDENGVMHKAHPFHIDFRTFPDPAKDSYYPMLKNFPFRPDTRWQRFSKKFHVKAYTNFYNIWVIPDGIADGGTCNTLYLDNFKFAYVDSKPTPVPEEYAVTPLRSDAVYSPGEKAEFEIRACLNSQAPSENGVLCLRREFNDSPFLEVPVRLERNQDGVYVGKSAVPAAEYGSFMTTLRLDDGRKLRGVDSGIVVLHPSVEHPWGAPGWGLGFNDEGLCPFGRSGSECINNYLISCNSFERKYRLLRASGAAMMRVWGTWRQIEPTEGDFTADITGLQMDIVKKYHLEPVFCLVGNFTVHGGRTTVEKWSRRGNSPMPEYLFRYYYQMPNKNMGSLLPPLDIYGKYLDFVQKTWGKQVRIWEMSNEPGVFGVPADRYIEYLKYTCRILKQRDPQSILLGNGVTGDFGMNVVKWCESLNEADPNYVDFLDAVAFHPYACGLDYINGVENLYEKTIRSIQGKLAKKKPMWNTECYYLPTAYRRQMEYYLTLSRYGSNELQRHFLDGLYHGVVAAPSPTASSYFHTAANTVHLAALNEVAAAHNALSFLLKDMTRLEKINVNRKVRCGMFTDVSRKKAMGFLYDLRPSGSTWTPGKSSARVLDLYGNECNGASHRLKFEPYYISGTPDEVRKMLNGSSFEVSEPIQLIARRAGNNLYVEGHNRTGTQGYFTANVGKLPVRFSFFRDIENSTVKLPGKTALPSSIRQVPETPMYSLPVELKLRSGTPVRVNRENGQLHFSLNVVDKNRKPAPDNAPWLGTSVEVFFDPTPFLRMDLDARKVFQYGFAAIAQDNGCGVFSGRLKSSAARRSVTLNADGYRMDIWIPLAELPEAPIYGFDIEINRVGIKNKESLGGCPGESFRRRNHYHLLSLPGMDIVRNGDFSKAEMGDPANWIYRLTKSMKVVADGKNGVFLENSGKSGQPLVLTQNAKIVPGAYRGGVFQILLKYEEVQLSTPGRGKNGVQMELRTNAGTFNYAFETAKADLTGSSGWKLYQLDFKLAPKAEYLDFRIGLGPGSTGKVWIESVSCVLDANPHK